MIKKYLYIVRLFKDNRLDEMMQLRYKITFLIATYSTMLAPVIIKLKGLLLPLQVITFFFLLEKLSNKSLEFLVEKFNIFQLWYSIIILHFLEMFIILTYFFDKTFFVVSYIIIKLLIVLVAKSYGIKQNDIYVKRFNDIKYIQIYSVNIWTEGFLLGAGIAYLLSLIENMDYIILVTLIFHIPTLIYMIFNWNFYEYYFDKIAYEYAKEEGS